MGHPGPGSGAERPAGRPLGWRALLGAYAAYAAGVAVATWPLVLAPGSVWPRHHDPYLFTWVMASMARRLGAEPSALFHGNALYPYGSTLALTEPLLVPAVLGWPGFASGHPVLTYNLLLFLLWPLDGLAMAWVAARITGSRPAAWLAGAAFCLAPYFTEYHVEFPMLLAAPIPVALLATVRWLETQRVGWLALALGALVVLGYTTWYYTIITGLALAVVGLGYLGLRWGGWAWRRHLLTLAVGVAGLVGLLLPGATPYLTVHRELALTRDLDEAQRHHPDVSAFLAPGSRNPLSRGVGLGAQAETSAFAGVAVWLLAALSLGWLREEPPREPAARRLGHGLRAILASGLAGAVASTALRLAGLRVGWLTGSHRVGELLEVALAAGLGLLVLRGAEAWQAGTPRRLEAGDWVRLLLLATGVFAVLALGPVIHAGGRPIGPGPYRVLYQHVPVLQALRITVRFAVICQAGLALLAALGLARLEARLRPRPGLRRLVLAGLAVLVVLDYAVEPLEVERVLWRRPVDRVLAADPAPAAVLEWPLNDGARDTEAMFHSLAHGRLLVNGHSGFVTDFEQELSGRLAASPVPLADETAQAALRRIYPLRYLVVRMDALDRVSRPRWVGLRAAAPALLRFRGSFEGEDLYELAPVPERGDRIERWMSYDFLREHPVLRLGAAPTVADPGLEQWVDVAFNARPLGRVPLGGPARVTLRLPPPYRPAAPNVVELVHGYRLTPAARGPGHRIGATGVLAPGDLVVTSSGDVEDRLGSIRLDDVELAPDRRGYNLVALEPGGRLLAATDFDTYHDPTAGRGLAAWVAALPAGTIVAGAVKDEGSARLTEEALRALRAVGAAGDLRGRYREAHAFVGVKGSPPGTALERLGSPRARVVVGRAERRGQLELDEFALVAPAAGDP